MPSQETSILTNSPPQHGWSMRPELEGLPALLGRIRSSSSSSLASHSIAAEADGKRSSPGGGESIVRNAVPRMQQPTPARNAAPGNPHVSLLSMHFNNRPADLSLQAASAASKAHRPLLKDRQQEGKSPFSSSSSVLLQQGPGLPPKWPIPTNVSSSVSPLSPMENTTVSSALSLQSPGFARACNAAAPGRRANEAPAEATHLVMLSASGAEVPLLEPTWCEFANVWDTADTMPTSRCADASKPGPWLPSPSEQTEGSRGSKGGMASRRRGMGRAALWTKSEGDWSRPAFSLDGGTEVALARAWGAAALPPLHHAPNPPALSNLAGPGNAHRRIKSIAWALKAAQGADLNVPALDGLLPGLLASATSVSGAQACPDGPCGGPDVVASTAACSRPGAPSKKFRSAS